MTFFTFMRPKQEMMKNLSIILLACAVMIGCSKDDDTPSPIMSVSCSIDGMPWESSEDGPHSSKAAKFILTNLDDVTMEAYAEDGSFLSLKITDDVSIKANTIYDGNGPKKLLTAYYYPDFVGNVFYSNLINGSGRLIFSTYTMEKVSGTFSFVGRNEDGDEISVTDGQFEIDR